VHSETKTVFVDPALLPVLEHALEIAPPDFKIPHTRIILLCPKSEKPKGTQYICVEELVGRMALPKQMVADREMETAYLCYSSGTESKPKAVETSHHNMTTQLQALLHSHQKLLYDDRILAVLPFSHIYGLTLLLHLPLVTCTPVVILPRYSEEATLQAIQDVSQVICPSQETVS
jgi:acyl-CoA synthetase (AMP-forming)/AMP-acid ligase II